ncbi:unnamed protein product [Lathyrus oleraceus]|nr:F-box/kelch-repeat protein At3g23880-like isoform X1 [Pisum sativum]
MFLHHSQSDTVSAAISHRIPSSVLPEELVGEILLRLPVKYLFQFKCVCKSWKTLISDPQFAKRHLRIKTTDNQMSVFTVLEESRIVSYRLKSLCENPSNHTPVTFSDMTNRDYRIIGSCNGLLCLLDREQRVRMCNPSIRFYSKKSPQPVSFSCNVEHCGFGYDEVNNKYRVLLVLINRRNNSCQTLTKVYTFGEDSWKTIQNFPLPCINPLNLSGKSVSGTLNWIVEKSGVSVILSFDLEKDTYNEMLLPQDDGGSICMLYVLNNCLGVCYNYEYFTKNNHWIAWLMKDYGDVESWTELIIIPNFRPTFFAVPLLISENDVLLANSLRPQLVVYNLNSGKFYHPSINVQLGVDLHIHRESLVLPPC